MRLTDKYEIKVFILFLLKGLNEPLDYDTITEISIQDGFVNFFEFAECFGQLVDDGMIDTFYEDETQFYLINPIGKEAVSDVENKLYNTVREQALRSAQRLLASKRDGTRITSEVEQADGGYNIICTIADNKKTVMRVQVYITEERYAHQLIGNFEDNAENVYKGVMSLLSGDVNYIFSNG